MMPLSSARLLDQLESYDEVEVLVRLGREPERVWTAFTLAYELRRREASVDDAVAHLQHVGVVRQEACGRVRYAAESPALERSAAELIGAYEADRLALIRFFRERRMCGGELTGSIDP